MLFNFLNNKKPAQEETTAPEILNAAAKGTFLPMDQIPDAPDLISHSKAIYSPSKRSKF